jgi:hypothetical protein
MFDNFFHSESPPPPDVSPDQMTQTRAGLWHSVQEFSHRLGERLTEMLAEVSKLEVKTYVSDDLSAQQQDERLLRAYTCIEFGGDIESHVPADGDDIDEALWQMHLDMVERAQEHRAALLKTLAEAATGLVDMLK